MNRGGVERLVLRQWVRASSAVSDVRRDRNRKWPCRSLIDRFGWPRQLAPLWMLLLVPKLPVVILPGADCQSLQTQCFLRVGRQGRWRGFCHVITGNDLTEFEYERKNFFFSQVALCNLIYFVSKDPPYTRLNINIYFFLKKLQA